MRNTPTMNAKLGSGPVIVHCALALAIAMLLGGGARPAGAQDSGVVKINGFDAGRFPQVRAFVSVTDASGRALQALNKDDFKIVEDGRAAEIVAIDASQDPIHVGLLIDHSGSMATPITKLTDAQAAANSFVDEMRAQDDAFVIMFDDQTDLLQDFTTDHIALQQAISGISVRGGTSFYDAVYTGASKFELRKEQRKNTLIALTDGNDNREDILARLLGSAGSKHSLEEATAQAKAMNVAVYTIGLGSDADQSRLQQIAGETGGRFFFAPNSSQLKELYRLIAEQLQKEYAIDFETPRAIADGTQRHVELTVQLPDGGAQSVAGLYVAGFLFNRIHADLPVGALLGAFLLLLAVAPTGVGMIARQIQPRRPIGPQVVPPAVAPGAPPEPAMTPCARCGRPMRVGARFCPSCGAAGSVAPAAPTSAPAATCPRCGRPVRAGAKFCGSCRAALR